jgi:hypothetical protein
MYCNIVCGLNVERAILLFLVERFFIFVLVLLIFAIASCEGWSDSSAGVVFFLLFPKKGLAKSHFKHQLNIS